MSTVIPAVNMPSGEPGNDKSATHTIRWPERSVIPPEVSCLYSVIRRRNAVAVLGLRAAMLVVQFEQLELDNVTTSDRSLCKPLNVIFWAVIRLSPKLSEPARILNTRIYTRKRHGNF